MRDRFRFQLEEGRKINAENHFFLLYPFTCSWLEGGAVSHSYQSYKLFLVFILPAALTSL